MNPRHQTSEGDVEEVNPRHQTSEGDREEVNPRHQTSEGDVEEVNPGHQTSEGVVEEVNPGHQASVGYDMEVNPLHQTKEVLHQSSSSTSQLEMTPPLSIHTAHQQEARRLRTRVVFRLQTLTDTVRLAWAMRCSIPTIKQ